MPRAPEQTEEQDLDGSAGSSRTPTRIGRRQFVLTAAMWPALSAPAIARGTDPAWRMVAMDYFPPYNYVSGGRFMGIDVDIMAEAARDMGVRIEFVPLPWRRSLMAFQSGEVDGMFQLAPTAQRFRDWQMVGPMRSTRVVLATLAGSGVQDFTGIADLRGRVIGTVNGFTYTPEFNTAPHFTREGSVDDETSLRKLLLGRVELIVGGQPNILHAADKLGMRDAIRILPTPLDVQPRYTGFLRDPARLEKAALLQDSLARMQMDGRIDAILHRNLAQ
ncbi:substrate-binding periplasmic protein [Paracoccus broussonetiae]|uniref:substrate-binding periplasmic protein n=1 Tax=Paracoccus broussonetiae TaxID=3075834 RepID=UPI00288B790D|nr:transporter substrate-binding domain-containing protein [Paracoccus sp. CPCC 101403]